MVLHHEKHKTASNTVMKLQLSGTIVTASQLQLLNSEHMPRYNLHCNMDDVCVWCSFIIHFLSCCSKAWVRSSMALPSRASAFRVWWLHTLKSTFVCGVTFLMGKEHTKRTQCYVLIWRGYLRMMSMHFSSTTWGWWQWFLKLTVWFYRGRQYGSAALLTPSFYSLL